MAALAASAVSLYPTAIDEGELFPFGKENRSILMRRLKLVLTGQGGQTNTIGAAALGFGRIISASNLFDDTNNLVYGTVVDPVANVILLDAGSSGTPTDVTSTATYITVVGTIPAPPTA